MTKIDGQTDILAVIGDPIEHSRSPLMQNAALGHLKLNMAYLPLHVRAEQLEDFMSFLRLSNVRGCNVTIPHKMAVANLVDELSVEARFLGAVNTVHNVYGKLKGYNTDVQGFLTPLQQKLGEDLKSQDVLMIGAGGSAQAVGFALCASSVRSLSLYNRSIDKAQSLAEKLNSAFEVPIHVLETLEPSSVESRSLIVNCTSLGMKTEDPELFHYDWIQPNSLCYDLIYEPDKTPFLKAAEHKGCAILNGLPMLVHQGALSLEIWTGLAAPVDVMSRALM